MSARTHPFGAHELIGWEGRIWLQLASLLVVCGCSLPLLWDLGLELQPPLHRLQEWAQLRATREASGFVALGFIGFQVSLGVARRLCGSRVARLHLWRTLHQVAPLGLLLVLLLHTRGKAGGNLNRWLITVLLIQIYLVQAGHVAKACLARYAGHPRLAALEEAANREHGLLHRVGMRLHVLFAVAVVILIAGHVLSVYYF